MKLDVEDYWAFIIDTNRYAGNFERELCAYCTGHVGDCGVGQDMAEVFFKEVEEDPFEEYILPTPDEHGCCRPVSIWPTPDWSNDGMGKETRLEPGQAPKNPAYMSVAIFFHVEPPEELCSIIMERCKGWEVIDKGRDNPKFTDGVIEKFRLVEIKTTMEEVEHLRVEKTSGSEETTEDT